VTDGPDEGDYTDVPDAGGPDDADSGASDGWGYSPGDDDGFEEGGGSGAGLDAGSDGEARSGLAGTTSDDAGGVSGEGDGGVGAAPNAMNAWAAQDAEPEGARVVGWTASCAFVFSSGTHCTFRAYRPLQSDAEAQKAEHVKQYPDHANAAVVTEQR
jgi:hypothetical protein